MNRREVLRQIVAVPFLTAVTYKVHTPPPGSDQPEDCLFRESAQGFRAFEESSRSRVLPAVRHVSLSHARRLLDEVRLGRSLIWESAAWFASPRQQITERAVLREIFRIFILPPVPVTSLFVEYGRPPGALVRSFSGVVPVYASGHEVLATLGGKAVAVKVPIGAGHLIFLGSMLGPHLYAGDSQAKQVAQQIFQI